MLDFGGERGILLYRSPIMRIQQVRPHAARQCTRFVSQFNATYCKREEPFMLFVFGPPKGAMTSAQFSMVHCLPQTTYATGQFRSLKSRQKLMDFVLTLAM